jgi:hypothetical protein
MLKRRVRALLPSVLGLVLGGAPRAFALIPGGGPAASDCYAEWQVNSTELTATAGKSNLDCEDGDPRCDVDGAANGACTFGVSVCIFQSDLPACTPQEVTEIRFGEAARSLGLPSAPTGAAAACGQAGLVSVRLRSGRRGMRKSKPLRLKLTALSNGKPRKDVDKLVLRCLPHAAAGECPENPSGGPRELSMAIAVQGTDLDNGWKGDGHNFPVTFGTRLRVCLTGCDGSTGSACNGDVASTEQVNGATFGSPLPLFSITAICLVTRFGSPKVSDVVADLATGEISARLNLTGAVYLTTPNQLCPRCSGGALGETGTCNGGRRNGQACRTDGVIDVTTAPGDQHFTLSSDCPPPGAPIGTINVALPLTTRTAMSEPGPRPCPGATADDACEAGTCDAACEGSACERIVDGQCVASLGGVSQVCCSSDTARPCFPTAGGGRIVRTGTANVPAPPFPDPTYPKSADGTLVGTYCIPATGSNLVNDATGLPGPGAIVLPVAEQWIR